MARFRLRSAHYFSGDRWLPGDVENGDGHGTVVGDGTEYPVEQATLEMIPLDEGAQAMIDEEQDRLARNQASMRPVDQLPMQGDTYETRYVPGFNARRL